MSTALPALPAYAEMAAGGACSAARAYSVGDPDFVFGLAAAPVGCVIDPNPS
ncbi:hypothetical protein EWM64_g2174 [Hericium alpestre]|uniref:Uncharacterized protein n=1 Tax=Hericium alpestre TaxID=135208 RepID=A0A4Z0A8A8_9AGAM|nr:hypothetical protein EWM64_g2174 [Hericium alpestre]